MPQLKNDTIVVETRTSARELATIANWLESKGIKLTSRSMLVSTSLHILFKSITDEGFQEVISTAQAIEIIERVSPSNRKSLMGLRVQISKERREEIHFTGKQLNPAPGEIENLIDSMD